MNAAAEVRALTVQLPDSAPLVRVTAGLGSAGQKTWNLRRPVTLLGAKRPAHIVLHDTDISAAHCAVVNTGTEVLLKDLHTSAGTFCNDRRIDLVVLKDGDVVRIGRTAIQVSIQLPNGQQADDSGCGLQYCDPTKFLHPVGLQLTHTELRWKLDDAIVLIGRHDKAAVRLDHSDIAPRHALLFRFRDLPAIFDLGASACGLLVNEQVTSLTPLGHNDQIVLGPFILRVDCESAPPVTATKSAAPPVPSTPRERDHANDSRPNAGAEPDPIEQGLRSAWNEMNSWQGARRPNESAMDERESNLTSRETEIEARDAALRGKLHDLSQFNEQILARERQVAAMAARVQADGDALLAERTAFDARAAELDKREKEQTRRENAVSQRWSRLMSTECPHCKKPIGRGNLEADGR
ncbi:MAG: FHA domain-containing protein [Planctomycetota bacterium]